MQSKVIFPDRLLARRGYTCLHGIDQDEKSFATADATFYQINLDVGSWGLCRKFSLITAIEVIEHLENPGLFLHNVCAHLDEDGYVMVTTPNIHSVGSRLRFLITGHLKSFDDKGDPGHIYPVYLGAVNRLFARYSLEIMRKWGYPAKGSLISRPTTRWLSKLCEIGLPDPNPGDTLCLLLRKAT